MKYFQRWKQTAFHNKALVLTGVIVAAGTSFYAGAAIYQICLMKYTAKQATVQTERLIAETNRIAKSMETANAQNRKAMEDTLAQSKATLDANIKAAELDQRAWVVVKDVKFENELKVGEINRFSLTFLNVGKTPAQHVRFKYTSRVHMPGKPDIVTPMTSDEYEDLSLGPGIKFVVSGNTLPPKLNQATVVGLESGTIVLTLSVEVTYQDVFRGGKLHKTAYCGFYKPENKPDLTICNSGNYME